MSQIQLHAIMDQDQTGQWYIVGLKLESGPMPAISSNRSVIEELMQHLEPERQKTARIVRFTGEVETQ